MKILDRFTGDVLYEDDSSSLRESVIAALASRADLAGANLTGADLTGADLAGANLTWANLAGANLARANLAGANLTWANLAGANLAGANLAGANLTWAKLTGANLTGADLTWADLTGAKLAWASRDLMAELLLREANGDLDKTDFAGRVLIMRGWCWAEHLASADPRLPWALGELARWIQPDDGHPECLDAYVVKTAAAAVDASEPAA